MTEPRCYLCGNEKMYLLYSIKQWKIYKCDKCSFVFVYPFLTKIKLKRLYLNFKANIFEKSKITLNDSNHSLRFLNKYRINRKTLLDIGCGNGIFLGEAIKYGWLVTGIDISSSLISYLKKTFDYEVYQGDILTTNIGKKFDVVTLNQVIEHFSDPKLLVKRCFNLLKKDGLIYIATPNISSIVAKIRKVEFDYVIPPEHLSYFNDKTLSRILADQGFRVLKTNTWSYPVDLAGLIKYVFGKKTSSKGNKSYEYNNKFTFIKYLKYLVFDKLFCILFYKFLNINNAGTMIEILAIKQ